MLNSCCSKCARERKKHRCFFSHFHVKLSFLHADTHILWHVPRRVERGILNRFIFTSEAHNFPAPFIFTTNKRSHKAHINKFYFLNVLCQPIIHLLFFFVSSSVQRNEKILLWLLFWYKFNKFFLLYSPRYYIYNIYIKVSYKCLFINKRNVFFSFFSDTFCGIFSYTQHTSWVEEEKLEIGKSFHSCV